MDMDASETLSAFVDGEPVEPSALAAALARPGAHEILVDFARLRAAVADAGGPAPAFVEAWRDRLQRRPAPVQRRGWLRLLAAGAVLGLAALGGYDLHRILRTEGVDAPPPPARVIRFEPGVDWGPVEGR
jgi:hypothetical protein